MPNPWNYQNKGLGKDTNFDAVNLGGQALKYLVPAARMLGNERALKNLRKESKLKLQPVSMLHGNVKDLARPNFTPRFRPAAGSSLSEYISGQKFSDAQARQMEVNYELENGKYKNEQERGIRESRNQETLYNTGLVNESRKFNTSNAQNEKLYRMQQQEDLQLGMTETALNDLTNKNYLDAAEKSSAASNILRYGQPGTPEYQKALKYYYNSIGEENLGGGGKIKRTTKFSR
jgi:hypothetical protein